jgi:hypothetical protein
LELLKYVGIHPLLNSDFLKLFEPLMLDGEEDEVIALFLEEIGVDIDTKLKEDNYVW